MPEAEECERLRGVVLKMLCSCSELEFFRGNDARNVLMLYTLGCSKFNRELVQDLLAHLDVCPTCSALLE